MLEAAHAEGASGLRIFWQIKLPLIYPTLGLVTILTFALADNAWTVPGVGVPNGLWCQSGGMPMKNPLANGDCEGCGGWQVSDSASGTFKSTRDFMGDVTNFARAHPIYSLLACQDGIATTTNCQLCAATLFKKLTGRAPSGHGVDCKPEGEWAAIARNTSTPTTRA